MKLEPLVIASLLLVVCGFAALVAGVWVLAGVAAGLITAGALCTALGVALAKGWM